MGLAAQGSGGDPTTVSQDKARISVGTVQELRQLGPRKTGAPSSSSMRILVLRMHMEPLGLDGTRLFCLGLKLQMLSST